MSALAENIQEYQSEAIRSIKQPPHSVEAEQAVLGGLMRSNNAWDIVSDLIQESDFYRVDHQLIFGAIKSLANKGEQFDVVTLLEQLEKAGNAEKAGGLQYIGLLNKDVPSAANIKAYANIVRERSVLRQLIEESTAITDQAFDPGEKPVTEILDEAQSIILNISSGAQLDKNKTITDYLNESINGIDERFNSDGSLIGISSGFVDIDTKTRGLINSDLIIVAGRPSMGKTTFAMNLVEAAAIKQKIPTLIFSMEMSGKQLVDRMISSAGKIDFEKIRAGDLSSSDWPRITSGTTLINDSPIYIDERERLSISQVRAKARKVKRQSGLGLVVVDYIQLMKPDRPNSRRDLEIAEISAGLKAMAKELDIPVIALSQLNRALENRPDKRPKMSDLRESGALEQDADIIVFIYRDVVYNENTEYPQVAEVNFAKHRNGPTGVVYLHAFLHQVRFDNHAGQIPVYPDAFRNTGRRSLS